MVTLQKPNFVKIMNPITGVFQVICLHLRSPCFRVDLKGKIEWILCYSKYLVLYFQPLQFVRRSDDGQSFTKRRIVRLTPFAFECEWSKDKSKLQKENTQWKGQCMIHESSMKITVSVCWCPKKLAYGIAQLVCIYTLLYFWHFIS